MRKIASHLTVASGEVARILTAAPGKIARILTAVVVCLLVSVVVAAQPVMLRLRPLEVRR